MAIAIGMVSGLLLIILRHIVPGIVLLVAMVSMLVPTKGDGF